MQETMLNIVNEFGYLGIMLLILIENIFPPIPSEAVLIFGGFLTTVSPLKVWFVIIWATAGSVPWAIILYIPGRIMSPDRLKKLFSCRVGRMLHLRSESVDTAMEWFDKHGKKTVLICRCVPVLRSIISIPAGMSKMSFAPFLILTALGSAVWNTVLVWVGVLREARWKRALNMQVRIQKRQRSFCLSAVPSLYSYTKKEEADNTFILSERWCSL